MIDWDARNKKIIDAIASYQTPFKNDATKIVCACIVTGKIDDLALKADQSREATYIEDTKQATDFIVAIGGLSIGFRLRKAGYFLKYKSEFTLRCNPRVDYAKGSSAGIVDYLAEFEKFLNGTFSDINIYGFMTPDNSSIANWVAYRPDLLYEDMDGWIESRIAAGKESAPMPWYVSYPIDNHDGTYFRSLKMSGPNFPLDCIIAHSGYLKNVIKPNQPGLFDRIERQSAAYR